VTPRCHYAKPVHATPTRTVGLAPRYACLLVGGGSASESRDRVTLTAGPIYFPPAVPGGSFIGVARLRAASRTPPTTSCNERHALSSYGIDFTHTFTDTEALSSAVDTPTPETRERNAHSRTPRDGEPLGNTLEHPRPGGSLHSLEHAGKRVLGACGGIRRLNGTQRNDTQQGGRLTKRNGTRYAGNATGTRRGPRRGVFTCGQALRQASRPELMRNTPGIGRGEHGLPGFGTRVQPRRNGARRSLPSRYAHNAVPFVFRECEHLTVTLWPRKGTKLTGSRNTVDTARSSHRRAKQELPPPCISSSERRVLINRRL